MITSISQKLKNNNQEGFRVAFHILALILIGSPPFNMDGEHVSLVRIAFAGTLVSLYLLNVLVLVPRLLKKGKNWAYFSIIFILTVVLQFFVKAYMSSTNFTVHFIENEVVQAVISDMARKPFPIFPFLMVFALGTGFEIFLEWERQKKLNHETEKEKIYAELMFLKSQINPHFLFNTLNNIYSLASKQSPNTDKAILLLSDMLRYNLYDTTEEKISIDKEVDFIKNYIELQKIRLTKKEEIHIEFKQSIDDQKCKIPPMILMPFIENAFKHGISYQRPSSILVQLELKEGQLAFHCANAIHHQVKNKIGDSGIGLENVKRRLALILPNKHTIAISENKGHFLVDLIMDLT